MSQLLLHHIAIVTRDLDRSLAFYQGVLGLKRLERPTLIVEGAWLGRDDLQLHVLLNPNGTFRPPAPIDIADVHFAFVTDDFEGTLARLVALGYRADAPGDDPKQMVVLRNSLTGFLQLYLFDPDGNIVEINAAPL